MCAHVHTVCVCVLWQYVPVYCSDANNVCDVKPPHRERREKQQPPTWQFNVSMTPDCGVTCSLAFHLILSVRWMLPNNLKCPFGQWCAATIITMQRWHNRLSTVMTSCPQQITNPHNANLIFDFDSLFPSRRKLQLCLCKQLYIGVYMKRRVRKTTKGFLETFTKRDARPDDDPHEGDVELHRSA